MTPFKGAVNLVGEAIGTVLFFVEHGFVLTLEGIRRFVCRFDWRVYDEKLRILNVEDGELSHGRNKFVIFVIYCRVPLPPFTTSAIEAFAAAGYDVVAVLNLPPHDDAIAYLRQRTRLIVHRANVGRDFGGYKDAISVLRSRTGVIDRLIIANDSIFYLEDGLSEVMARLDGPADFIGASEVFDHHYHVGSYLLSFSRKVVESNAFKSFWESYKPLTTRRWAILKGEGRLSAALIKAGFQPDVLFRAEDLRPHLAVTKPAEFADLISLLPISSRRQFERKFEGVCKRLGAATATDGAVDTASPIINAVTASNQMHTGGFLFRRFMRLPIIKRDIVFRELYELTEVRRALADLPPEALDEIMQDLSSRGTGAQLAAWSRMLYRHSAI